MNNSFNPEGSEQEVRQKKWDVAFIDIAPVKVSYWGIDDEWMQRLAPRLKRAGLPLSTGEKGLVTFKELEEIVAYLHRRALDTGNINAAVKQAVSQLFREAVQEDYSKARIRVRDDLQKGRWGGSSRANNLLLEARVKNSFIQGLYSIEATVRSESTDQPLNGLVAFFLHDTFPNEIEYVEAKDGVASLQIDLCYEAFTLAAFTEDGTTLELDLNEVPGFPEGFYWENLSRFQDKAIELYEHKPVLVSDDLQKRRWGGKSKANDKVLTALVDTSWIPGFYNVYLNIRSDFPENFIGEVAFFLHDTFGRVIRFAPVKDGVAELTVKAYEAFTVGAYTADGTELELDLNEVPGYPEEFYYSREAAS